MLVETSNLLFEIRFEIRFIRRHSDHLQGGKNLNQDFAGSACYLQIVRHDSKIPTSLNSICTTFYRTLGLERKTEKPSIKGDQTYGEVIISIGRICM